VEPKPVTNSNTAPPAKLEVVQLADEPAPKVARDSSEPAPRATTSPPVSTKATSSQTELKTHSEPPPQKKRIVERLNPTTWFRGKHRAPNGPTPLDSPAEATTTSDSSKAEPTPHPAEPVRAPVPTFTPDRHYAYQNPSRPPAGDRSKAQSIFAQAVQDHRDGRMADAVDNYRQAIKLDPSFFEAQYNLGLAAYELKDLPLSLSAYETALSINPTSANARYSFALALEKGGYYTDATNELEKLLSEHPDETRAHFSLASLYADKVIKPDLAGAHYRKVLELEPQHPQAAAIRYWLAANP
jgi:hypothetical protein